MTIEERAKQYALEKCGGTVKEGTKGMIYSRAYDEYVKIANEQKKIDDDLQAAEMERIDTEWRFNTRIERKLLISKSCDYLKKYCDPWLIECYKKNMKT